MQRGRKDDVDIDSLLESLVHDKKPAPRQHIPSASRRAAMHHQQPRPQQIPQARTEAPPAALQQSVQPRQTQAKQPAGTSAKKLFLSLSLAGVILVAIVGAGLWAIPKLLDTKSPFSQELQDKMGTPLYYPAKLPGTFKMETDSITQPESDVVLYAISNEDGKRINITLQKQPDGLNLEPLYAVLKDVREVDTDLGKVKVGMSDEGLSVANIVTERTWIIISGGKDTLSTELLAEVVNGLKS